MPDSEAPTPAPPTPGEGVGTLQAPLGEKESPQAGTKPAGADTLSAPWLEKPSPFLERTARRLLETILEIKAGRPTEEELSRPALVFSPHKDDETLGLGATIQRKVRAGAPVKLLFFTDGGNSGHGLMPPKELSDLRTREALAAGRALGLAEKDLVFLELEDGRLGDHKEEALTRVLETLAGFHPREVYLPYKHETTPDHISARRIALEALDRAGLSVRVHEYPVWFWFHWPWVRTTWVGLRKKPARILTGLVSGWRLLRDINLLVPTRGFLEGKRQALACYRSQITRLVDDPGWTTLGEIGGGEFLRCFFRKSETFHSYEF